MTDSPLRSQGQGWYRVKNAYLPVVARQRQYAGLKVALVVIVIGQAATWSGRGRHHCWVKLGLGSPSRPCRTVCDGMLMSIHRGCRFVRRG